MEKDQVWWVGTCPHSHWEVVDRMVVVKVGQKGRHFPCKPK